MVDDDNASHMIEALQGASSMQLYQMRALIDGLLADTKRTIAARAALHLGQPVQFIDHRTGQVRRGKLIARHDTQATVLEEGVSRSWKISYVAIAAAPSATDEQPKIYEPPPEPAAPIGRVGFKLGDKVTFDDAKGRAQLAMITADVENAVVRLRIAHRQLGNAGIVGTEAPVEACQELLTDAS